MSKTLKEIAFIQVLKIKDFRNLWLSQLISQVFLNLLFFSLMISMYELTRSNSAVSVLVFLVTLPNILLGALAGVLVDKWGRKPVMFLSHFVRFFAVLAFLVSSETLGWVYSLAFLISVVSQFFFPAEAATIPDVVKDKKLLLAANGLFSITFFGSVIIGNVLAGPMLRIVGPQITFIVVALAFLLAAFFTSRLPGDISIQKVTTNTNLFSDFLVGLDHIYKNPLIQKGILALGASQITIGILGTIAPGFADKILKINVTDVSLFVMAPAAAGMGLGAFMVGQYFRKIKRETLIKVSFACASIGLIAYSFVDKITLSIGLPLLLVNVLILVGLGMSNAMLDIPVNTMIQENTSEEVRSRVYGVVSSVIGLAGIFPIVISGALADVVGVRAVMLFSGVALLAVGVYTQSKFRQNVSSTV